MSDNQLPEKIKKLAMDLDDVLEAKEIDFLISCFSEDCRIDFLGIKLKGTQGVEKWLKYLYNHVKSMKLEPVVIMVQDNIFFEEFIVNATVL